LALVVAGCGGALVSGRPEAVLVVVPFALALVAGLSLAPAGAPSVTGTPAITHLREGDELEVVVDAGSIAGAGARWCTLEIAVVRAEGFAAAERLSPGDRRLDRVGRVGLESPQTLTARIEATRWGRRSPGRVVWRARDVLGFWEVDGEQVPLSDVTVYPRPEVLDRLLAPARAPLPAGTHVANGKGAGFELAGVRPYSRGDRAKDINWRSTARHGWQLFTNERHPERAGDVVLGLDSFEPRALERAVAASCALAHAFLRQRDRVGIVKFGGWLGWLRPGTGPRHEWVLMDQLLTISASDQQLYRSLMALPPKSLPQGALLLVVSSLENDRAVEAVTAMARRGLDVAVLQVEPDVPAPAAVPTNEPEPVADRDKPVVGPRHSGADGFSGFGGRDRETALASVLALWRLSAGGRTEALRAAGVPCAVWRANEPLAVPVDELVLWGRVARGGRR
jgi:uncharacterized protein (DUF58 family)